MPKFPPFLQLPILSRRHFLGLAAAAMVRGNSIPMPAKRMELLDEIGRRACQFFLDHADPQTGLVRDRARTLGYEDRRIASIAATGFGLSALCIADLRGYAPSVDLADRVEKILTFLLKKAPHEHGFFYHFCDMTTGARAWQSELSSVDTAWLLCGALHCRAHFDTKPIRRLVSQLLDRVNWRWMLNGGSTLSHGWTPEDGFLPYRWDNYSELLAMYLLAMGSRTFPIPTSCWDNWARPGRLVETYMYIESPAPLFVHQYSHAWFDFRNKQDGYTDYFRNSQLATQANRDLCVNLKKQFPWYSVGMWGVTSSESRGGYVEWGGPHSKVQVDGTLVPCAAGGSLVFLPDDCTLVLHNMLERYGKMIWTQYGFVDAFHPGDHWYSSDVIGIDLGIMLLMAENLRSESVWGAVMSTPEAARGITAAGFYRAG